MDTSLAYGLASDDRLAELGLEQADFWYALDEGLHYAGNLTRHDTRAARGIGIWNAINRGLGDRLVTKCWVRTESKNWALTIHPERFLRIAVLAGDRRTGTTEGPEPRNCHQMAAKHQKLQTIGTNRQIVHKTHFSSVDPAWGVPTLTYFFLHHMDLEIGEVRGELSLAVGHTREWITEWHERIIFSRPDGLLGDALDSGQDPPIEVPVVERSA